MAGRPASAAPAARAARAQPASPAVQPATPQEVDARLQRRSDEINRSLMRSICRGC
jgi:hypothetical protein